MGVDRRSRGERWDKSPRIWSGGIVPPDFVMLQNFKHQITCIAMYENVLLPLQQDFYSKYRHASPPRIQWSQISSFLIIPIANDICQA